MGVIPRRHFHTKARGRKLKLKICSREQSVKSLLELRCLVHQIFTDKLPINQMSMEQTNQRRSIDRICKKTADKQTSQAEGSSPVLRGRKRKSSAATPDQPLAKKMAEGQILEAINNIKTGMDAVQDQLKSCATSKDLDKLVSEIRDVKSGVQTNNERIEKLYELRKEDQASLAEKVEAIVDKRLSVCQTKLGGEHDINRRTQYLLCRRSVRMWPVDLAGGKDKGVRTFMRTFLSMPEQMVNNTRIETIEAIQQPRRSKITEEVMVRFHNAQTRDSVQSYAVSLAQYPGKAGLRLEVPDHLRGLFRQFEAHGAALKAEYGSVKRSVRFNDETESLCMDVRLENTQWHRITGEDMAGILSRKKAEKTKQQSSQGCNKERQKILMMPSKETSEEFHECEDE